MQIKYILTEADDFDPVAISLKKQDALFLKAFDEIINTNAAFKNAFSQAKEKKEQTDRVANNRDAIQERLRDRTASQIDEIEAAIETSDATRALSKLKNAALEIRNLILEFSAIRSLPAGDKKNLIKVATESINNINKINQDNILKTGSAEIKDLFDPMIEAVQEADRIAQDNENQDITIADASINFDQISKILLEIQGNRNIIMQQSFLSSRDASQIARAREEAQSMFISVSEDYLQNLKSIDNSTNGTISAIAENTVEDELPEITVGETKTAVKNLEEANEKLNTQLLEINEKFKAIREIKSGYTQGQDINLSLDPEDSDKWKEKFESVGANAAAYESIATAYLQKINTSNNEEVSKRLKEIFSTLKIEMDNLGYGTDNPFVQFIMTQISDNKFTSRIIRAENYNIIHNLFVDRLIDANDLRYSSASEQRFMKKNLKNPLSLDAFYTLPASEAAAWLKARKTILEMLDRKNLLATAYAESDNKANFMQQLMYNGNNFRTAAEINQTLKNKYSLSVENNKQTNKRNTNKQNKTNNNSNPSNQAKQNK